MDRPASRSSPSVIADDLRRVVCRLMPRPPGVELRRRARTDGTITYWLRVRVGGADESILLGNTADGWDEARADRARRRLLSKIELGLWRPGETGTDPSAEREPIFPELATE